MKALTGLLVTLVVVYAPVWAGDYDDAYFERLIVDAYQQVYETERWKTATTSYQHDMGITRGKVIRKWAASGEICRVLGHRWEPYESMTWSTVPRRKCSICGKVEVKEEVWR